MTRTPTITATQTAAGQLTFRCRYCRRRHFHSPSGGLRTAHCTNPRSPYLVTGYYLRVGGRSRRKWTPITQADAEHAERLLEGFRRWIEALP